MVELVNLILHFRGEANAMQRVTTLKAAHDFAYFTNFPNARASVTVLYVNTGAWLSVIGSVVTIVGNVAGSVLDEIVVRGESRALDDCPGGGEKITSFMLRHVEIDGFEQAPINKAATQIAQDKIRRVFPLLHVKNHI